MRIICNDTLMENYGLSQEDITLLRNSGYIAWTDMGWRIWDMEILEA